MRNKTIAIFMSVCMLILLASCGKESKVTSAKNVEKKSTTQTTKAKVNKKEMSDLEIRNYYNDFTAEDNKAIFCIDAYGLYRISKSDNSIKKLLNFDKKETNIGWCLTLHNDYIYFTTSKGLFRIKKDGSNYYKFSNISKDACDIKCVKDKLFVEITGKYKINYCVNIKNDPESPQFKETNKTFSEFFEEKIYFTEHTGEVNQQLYSSDVNGKNKNVIVDDVNKYYVHNDKIFIIPFNMDNLYVCDINGKKSKPLYKITDRMRTRFLYYDNDWLYIHTPSSDNKHFYKRINIKTKEVIDLDKLNSFDKCNYRYFEISSGYIFTRDGHAKYIKSDGTGKWHEIN